MNDSYRRLVNERDWDFVQKTATAATVALQQFYPLPFDYQQLISVNIALGTQIYTPREAPTRKYWDQLNSVSSWSSNYPEWYFIFDGQIGFYPTPSSTGNTITYSYDRLVIDLSIADYTTGNVTAVTNGSTTVTGTGTTWTTPMAGRWIKINPTSTAGATGDGYWYEIASVASATSLTLVKAYQGATITAATAYTIGEMSILPDAFQDIPVYEAAMTYFMSIKPEAARYQMFQQIYQQKHKDLIMEFSQKSIDPMIEDSDDANIINPNIFISA